MKKERATERKRNRNKEIEGMVGQDTKAKSRQAARHAKESDKKEKTDRDDGAAMESRRRKEELRKQLCTSWG